MTDVENTMSNASNASNAYLNSSRSMNKTESIRDEITTGLSEMNRQESNRPRSEELSKSQSHANANANIDPPASVSMIPNAFIEPSQTKKKTNYRRIISEDPEWNLAAVETLKALCLKSIVTHFEKNPILVGIPDKYREKIISSVSTDLPLPIASKLIPDEAYWQRRSQQRYKLCSIEEHNHSWKQLYFELHIRDMIETFVPKTYGDELVLDKVTSDLKIASDYVEKLVIRQLRPTEPPELNPINSINDAFTTREAPKELIIKPTEPLPNHFNISLLFSILHKLKELSLFYGVKDCGINFNWAYFGMTLIDCQRLSDSLKTNSTLVSLGLQSSGMDDDKCRLLASALAQNSTLTKLDLTYNKIGDEGSRALAKVLSQPSTALSHLLLGNNKVGVEGALALAKALTLNSTLQHLDLRLNFFGDQGANAICLQACKNMNIESINLSGNGLGSESVAAICVLLRRNLKKLTCLDFSCNKLGNSGSLGYGYLGTSNLGDPTSIPTSNSEGDATGKSIFEAVSRNKYITRLDLRMTDLSEDILAAIQGILKENNSI